jgi:hypothetical protein
MAGMDTELEEFKHLDLRAYAASQGYSLDRNESWRGSAVMRNEAGDKIIIKRENDGHYVFFNVRDDADNGTIIDFCLRRKCRSLGGVRRELRPWIGAVVDVPAFRKPLEKSSADRGKVDRALLRMHASEHHPYLEQTRGISPALLESPRFRGSIFIDGYGNAVFPHVDDKGCCGYELKNNNFTGFAKFGEKGLWLSNGNFDTDNRWVFCESGVEVLSYAQIFEDHNTRYASVAGEMNPRQPGLIKWFASAMPPGAEIIAAMNNDAAGEQLAEAVGKAIAAARRSDLKFGVHLPDHRDQDWNDVLLAKHSFPTGRSEFSPGR